MRSIYMVRRSKYREYGAQSFSPIESKTRNQDLIQKRWKRKRKTNGRGYMDQWRDDDAPLVWDALPVSQNPVAVAEERCRLLFPHFCCVFGCPMGRFKRETFVFVPVNETRLIALPFEINILVLGRSYESFQMDPWGYLKGLTYIDII